jgi:chromosome segregation ATPase
MPTEGTAVFEGLQAGLREAETFLAQCDRSAGELDGQMSELLSRRGEALLELARHFLPEISRPAIEATFEGIRGDLLAILTRKDQRQRELQSTLGKADEDARRHDAEIDDVTRKLNEKVAQRERLEAQVAATLKANDDFQQRSKLALQAEEQLHRNEQRVAEIQKEAAEKLPHYDRSRLFRYLYKRGYGTSEYQARGIVLELDRWVAGLIRFGEARGGYEFLKRTPELVTAEVERRRATFTELMQQVEAIQKAEADRAGLTAVLAEGEQLGARRDQLVQELTGLRETSQKLQQELAGLGQSQNAFYTDALERFRAFLGETRVALLEERARKTPEPDDDAIVAEIAGLDAQLEQLRPGVAELADRRQAADRVRAGLDQVVQRFRQANYDSQRSYFDDSFDLRPALARFQAGHNDAGALWSEIESSQRFRPHWVESTAAGAGQVLSSPTGRVFMGAIVDAANIAMRDAAFRGVQRRGEIYVPSPGPDPQPQAMPQYDPPPAPAAPSYSPPEPSEGSFTTVEGF